MFSWNREICLQGPSLVIHHSEEVIDNMNEWSKEHHAKSGLTQRVRESTISMAEAELAVLEFIRKHCDSGVGQLTGNCVYTDMIFLVSSSFWCWNHWSLGVTYTSFFQSQKKYMPKICDYLHYRLVDVSTVKEICKRWFPREYRSQPRKTLQHTAMSDIEESLEELKYYRRKIFKKRKNKS